MAQDRAEVLSDVVALAHLFNSCVEAFGLIHPHATWDTEEQLQLTKLGIQQARLLVWGSIVGITSPPASIATHMVPAHPGATNPNPDDAIYFEARDPRLDDPETRKHIKGALTDILDRSEHGTRDEMMNRYGLKSARRSLTDHQPALDFSRLQGSREKYALLMDLAMASSLRPPRSNSVVAHSWIVHNHAKFADFVALIRAKVGSLIQLMDLEEKVDRAVKIDIRALGWHPAMNKAMSAMNVSKLRIIHEACQYDYPSYAWVTQQALDNINDRWKGMHGYDNMPVQAPRPFVAPIEPPQPNDTHGAKTKRPGILSKLLAKGPPKHSSQGTERSQSLAQETPRSRSLSTSVLPPNDEPIRSKSVSAASGVPIAPMDQELPEAYKSAHASSASTYNAGDLASTPTFGSMISRHDQWRDGYN